MVPSLKKKTSGGNDTITWKGFMNIDVLILFNKTCRINAKGINDMLHCVDIIHWGLKHIEQ